MHQPDTRRREHLRALLQALEADDATEARHKSRMLELLDVADDPFSGEHYVPGHFTASAFIVTPNASALLLILHQKLGRWLQPGGHMEASDVDVLQAVRREVHEEVGLVDLPLRQSGLLDVDIHAIPARGAVPAHEHFDVRFVFEAPTQEATAGSDARDARWVSLNEVESIESDASVMRAVRKLRSQSQAGRH
ncbi:MAG TPA: NUDIX hydrolase [Polyangiales bacterium]